METTMTITARNCPGGLRCPSCGYGLQIGARLWVTGGGLQCRNCRYPRRWLSASESAKFVRAALKAAFPAQRFSVRSETYSGGASIDVRWTEGPATDAVNAVVQPFRAADFDGSIDLKTYREHWLLPDGTVTLAQTPGTEGSMGYLPRQEYDAPCEGAQRVHFGADYISCYRETAEETARRQEWQAEWNVKKAARKARRMR